jgi:hypothetical protein
MGMNNPIFSLTEINRGWIYLVAAGCTGVESESAGIETGYGGHL